MKFLHFLGLALWIGLSVPATAQQTYQLSSTQKFTVSGTSSIHDWEMVSEGATGTAKIELDAQTIESIPSLQVQLPSKTLKSGKSSMDSNAYEALNASKHPQITFVLTEVESISGQMIRAKGKLTISGTTQNIGLDVNYRATGNEVKFTGQFPISFSQFNLEPPTAVFGTIKTGDKLNISFETTFKTK